MSEMEIIIARLTDELRRRLTEGIRNGLSIPELTEEFRRTVAEMGYETLLQQSINGALWDAERLLIRDLGAEWVKDHSLGNTAPLTEIADRTLRGFTRLTERMEEQVIAEIRFSIQRNHKTSEIADRLVNRLSAQRSHAETWARTSRSGIATEYTVQAAKSAGIEHLQLVGPSPERAFCREHYREIKTIEEWSQLDNRQGLPVITYVGGYRCVHRLRAYIKT